MWEERYIRSPKQNCNSHYNARFKCSSVLLLYVHIRKQLHYTHMFHFDQETSNLAYIQNARIRSWNPAGLGLSFLLKQTTGAFHGQLQLSVPGTNQY